MARRGGIVGFTAGGSFLAAIVLVADGVGAAVASGVAVLGLATATGIAFDTVDLSRVATLTGACPDGFNTGLTGAAGIGAGVEVPMVDNGCTALGLNSGSGVIFMAVGASGTATLTGISVFNGTCATGLGKLAGDFSGLLSKGSGLAIAWFALACVGNNSKRCPA